MKRGLIIADTHLSANDPVHHSYQLVKNFAKDFKPDFVVDLGDTLHLDYFASFNADDIKLLAENSWEEDVDLINKELDFWQDNCQTFHWVQGNHDERTERVAKKAPFFADSLDYYKRFHLKARGIKFYRLVDRPLKIGKLCFIHGWYWNKYCTSKTLDEYAGNIIFGHIHRMQTYSRVLMAKNEEIQAWSLSCLSDKEPDYRKGQPTGWTNGFAVVYMRDNGTFNLYPINIIKGGFIFEGKEYTI